MNSQIVPHQYKQECVYQMVYEIAVCLLLLFIRCTIIFYINNKLSKIAKVSERNEARAQITSKQIDNISELCERLIVQNVGAYDRSAELARDMDAKFDNITKQISTIPSTFDKMLATTICDLVDNISATNKNIEEIHSVRALDNVEGLYQCWTGTGVWFKEGSFKFTTEIRITNKYLKTYRENQMWMGSENNASIAYRDALMESIYSTNHNAEHGDFNIRIPLGFIKKTIGRTEHITPRKGYMNCVKYEWDGSIEIDISITEVYCDMGPSNGANNLMVQALRLATIDWKKSLVPQ
jgi:hypothetical protein